MARRALASALLLPLLLTSCGGSADPASFAGTRLDPPFTVAKTPLVDQEGEAFSLTEDTDKDITLVFFGYINCPDICGQVMATLAGTLSRLSDEQKERVDVVFVTTDPARDDAPAVGEYVAAFDPTMIGLTGDMGDIIGVGRSLGVGIELGEKMPSGGYDVTHGTRVYAVDSADESPMMWSEDVSQAELTRDVTMLLDEG